MLKENFPSSQEPEITEQGSLLNPDGSLNEDLLSQRYGLGIEEASQEVSFGSYRGTVAQMLSDERCPVGAMVSTAYQEKGLDGVVERFKSLAQMDPQFSIRITPTTRQREQVKKK
jgi:hypothetical protein